MSETGSVLVHLGVKKTNQVWKFFSFSIFQERSVWFVFYPYFFLFFIVFIFLSVFSLTDTNDSQESREQRGDHYFSCFLLLPVPIPANIHLVHRDFYHFFLTDLFVVTRVIADKTCSPWKFPFYFHWCN